MKIRRSAIRFIALFALMTLLIVATVQTGLAAGMLLQEPDYTDLTAVLTWLAGAGGPYFVGQVLSLLAENWPKWHELPKGVKIFAPIVASPLVAILATLALQQFAVIEVASPWYTIVAGSILGYLGTQQAYLSAKRVGYGAKV